MNYNGINHLALATADMDRTVRFWRDLLGLRLVAGLGRPGYRQYFFEISETDLLAFFEWPSLEPVPEKEHGVPVKGPFVFDHVSLGVSTEDDLWEVKDRLEAAGIWVSEVIDHGFIHSIYSFDPNGVPVEFSWNVPGADIRRRPSMTDREPSDVTRWGPDSQPGVWPPVTSPTPRSERRRYPGDGQAVLGPK
jgi:catechol 2,3-dioxygenase-like lactoylglutathione lyase family enzyme